MEVIFEILKCIGISIIFLFLLIGMLLAGIGVGEIISSEIKFSRWRKNGIRNQKKKDEGIWQTEEATQKELDVSNTPGWLGESDGTVYGRDRWVSPTLVGKRLFTIDGDRVVEVEVLKGWYKLNGCDVSAGMMLLKPDGKTVNYNNLSMTHNFFNTVEDCKINNFIEFLIPDRLWWIVERYHIGRWYTTISPGFGAFIRWRWDGVKAVRVDSFRILLRDFTEKGLRVKFIKEDTHDEELYYVGDPIDQTAKVWDGTYPTKEECEEANEIEIVRFKE